MVWVAYWKILEIHILCVDFDAGMLSPLNVFILFQGPLDKRKKGTISKKFFI